MRPWPDRVSGFGASSIQNMDKLVWEAPRLVRAGAAPCDERLRNGLSQSGAEMAPGRLGQSGPVSSQQWNNNADFAVIYSISHKTAHQRIFDLSELHSDNPGEKGLLYVHGKTGYFTSPWQGQEYCLGSTRSHCPLPRPLAFEAATWWKIYIYATFCRRMG